MLPAPLKHMFVCCEMRTKAAFIRSYFADLCLLIKAKSCGLMRFVPDLVRAILAGIVSISRSEDYDYHYKLPCT